MGDFAGAGNERASVDLSSRRGCQKTFVGENRHPTLFSGGSEGEASPSLPPSLLVRKGESFGIVDFVVQRDLCCLGFQ